MNESARNEEQYQARAVRPRADRVGPQKVIMSRRDYNNIKQAIADTELVKHLIAWIASGDTMALRAGREYLEQFPAEEYIEVPANEYKVITQKMDYLLRCHTMLRMAMTVESADDPDTFGHALFALFTDAVGGDPYDPDPLMKYR